VAGLRPKLSDQLQLLSCRRQEDREREIRVGNTCSVTANITHHGTSILGCKPAVRDDLLLAVLAQSATRTTGQFRTCADAL